MLEQTKDTGINVYTHVYTHGEMLPAHGYPNLKRHPHLVGHYRGAWMRQRKEFDEFPGAILMTTNRIQAPPASYQDRLFTSGLAAWPGVTYIADRDYAPVIAAASEPRHHLTGFGHTRHCRSAMRSSTRSRLARYGDSSRWAAATA